MSATRQAVQAGRLPINPCLLQLIMVLPLRVWQGYTWGKYRAAKRWSPQDGAERPEEKTSYTSSDSEAPGRATRCPLSGSRHHPASRANLEASRGYNVGGTVDRRVPRHPWESRITTARERDRTVNRGEGVHRRRPRVRIVFIDWNLIRSGASVSIRTAVGSVRLSCTDRCVPAGTI